MTRWQQWTAVAVAVLAVGTAQAQRPQGGGMRGGFQQPLHVLALTNEELQKDLKITDDQKKSLKEATDKMAEVNKKMADARGGGGQPDREKMQELQKEMTKAGEDAKAATDKAFTDDQKKRLKQIEVQRMGMAAFSNEDVVKAMKFTDDQKAKLKTLGEEMTKARADLQKEYGIAQGGRGGQGGGQRPDPEKMAEFNKKAAALTSETMDKVKKELTDDQKKAWADLTGAAFDLTKLQQRPMRRDN